MEVVHAGHRPEHPEHTLRRGVRPLGHPSGVYRSTDSGGSWITTGLTNVGVLARWPSTRSTPSTLYAGTFGRRLPEHRQRRQLDQHRPDQ